MSEIIHLNKEQTKGIAFVDKFGKKPIKIKATTFSLCCAYCIFAVSNKDGICSLCDKKNKRYCLAYERKDNTTIIWVEDKDNVTLFREITQKMAETYEKKNADYGDSFGKSLNEFGLIAGIVRMSDKFNRIKQLVNNEQQVKDESIKDTLLDLACYSVMSLVWLEQKGR
ncbi:MAG: DUF1599 domain-containing protein [Bacteroidales bacterium]|nr:DUF1599 domain-containing protein [Bacteroidales bacterium]